MRNDELVLLQLSRANKIMLLDLGKGNILYFFKFISSTSAPHLWRDT